MDERKERRQAKKIQEKDADKNIFVTFLNDVDVESRQEALKVLGKGESLKLESISNDRILEFQVFTPDGKSIGIIPSKLSKKIEAAMEEDLRPDITNYLVIEEEEKLSCDITVVFKKAILS